MIQIKMMSIEQSEAENVGANYNKLFKLLIDKRMKKGDLFRAANISQSTLAKLGNGENVNTDILVRICNVLGCDFGDIMEFLPDELPKEGI